MLACPLGHVPGTLLRECTVRKENPVVVLQPLRECASHPAVRPCNMQCVGSMYSHFPHTLPQQQQQQTTPINTVCQPCRVPSQQPWSRQVPS